MTRKHWWQGKNRNNNAEGNTMGNDWQGDPEIVTKALGKVRPVRPVPPIETAAHDDFVAQEQARAEQMAKRDLGLYEAALTAFLDRVRALPELGGELASDQQFAELVTLESLLTAARARAQIITARRRDSIGLFRQMTGQPLPSVQAWAEAKAADEYDRYHSQDPGTTGTFGSAEAYAARMDRETAEARTECIPMCAHRQDPTEPHSSDCPQSWTERPNDNCDTEN